MEHLGLVGLPDSGHAQLFSALTGIDTPTGFETTKGVAPLPDDRVDRLAEMSKSKKRIHATFEIDFIAGLASVEQRLARQRRALKGDKTLAGEVAALERAEAVLGDGTPVYRSDLTA